MTTPLSAVRTMDPVLYPPTIHGHGPEKHHVRCPFSAQVRPKRTKAEGRGIRFDLANQTRPSPQCASNPPAAGRAQPSPKKWGSATPMACPAVNAPKERRSTCPRYHAGAPEPRASSA
jgi:hypothetical protein